MADRPPDFPPGTAWSYSNTGYHLLGLILEAATGNPLDQELDRCILGPLGLRGTWLPTHAPGIPSPASRGYSLPRSPSGDMLDGPLLDVTVQDPSHAWAAGGLVSDLPGPGPVLPGPAGRPTSATRAAGRDADHRRGPARFHPTPLYDRYGLGLLEVETPAGRLVGNAGGIPGFLNMVLSTHDGRRQLGVMINLLAAPDPVYVAFMRVVRELSSIRPGLARQV